MTARGFYRAKGDACVSVSIVSHGHGEMVWKLVAKLQLFPEVSRIILTRNIPDNDGVVETDKTLFIQNTNPKGFGANHNAAFAHTTESFFCVLNPDIELPANPFPALLAALNTSGASVLAPAVVNSAGSPEDSARRFPTLRRLATKLLGGHDGRYVMQPTQGPAPVDWVAGMYMLFPTQDFKAIGGFDDSFFLYYEDVDICPRLWKSGRPVMVCPQVQVVHDAQRASRKNWQFMKWHAASMARYFWKHWGRLPRKSVS